jgi:dipeptidyl-peptidase 4
VTRLTVEALFSSPALNGSVPIQVRFSPDGTRVTYLANPPEDRDRLDLYGYDVATDTTQRLINAGRNQTDAELSTAEKAERERRRLFSSGVTSYRWLPDSRRICCVIDGGVYLFDCAAQTLRAITAEGVRQTDLTVSGRGRYLSYVRDGDLYLFDLELDREERLTHDATESLTNGLAEFIAQEEMHRFEGHWWSPDDRYLVFARVDSSMIPTSFRYEFTASELVAVAQRYPYAGADNAQVDLGVMDLQSRAVRWIDYRAAPDDYLARVNVGTDVIVVQSQSRDQRTLRVVAHPLNGSAPTLLVSEQQPAWINLHNNFRFVADGGFLWTSERSGTSQVYWYRGDSSTVALSGERGRINEIVHADKTHVFVLGWIEGPTEQHLFRIAYDLPGVLQRLTPTPGWHETIVDPTGKWFVDRYSNVEQPPCLFLRSATDPAHFRAFSTNALTEGHPYYPYLPEHSTPTFGTISAADGQDLWYRLTMPRSADSNQRCPVLVNVYGGPGVQRVRDEWSPLTNQLFAAMGIAVFELDNRGGTNRAKAFEDPIQGRLGRVEVEDQLAGIEFLKRQPWADPQRIGVIGHSYGGFMTLMLMARNRGDIRAGVSTAPVTDWSLYDTHYTERYLGTPQNNPDGYAASCVAVDSIRGALLLMHGMADDNVLFANTTSLMRSLQARRFPFELMLYPGSKHSLQERDVAVHRYDTILNFLERRLLS